MKKTIKLSLLTAFVAVTAFFNPLKAQDVSKELGVFAQKFETLYNKKDGKSLQTMYTEDATRTASDGTVTTGSKAIIALYSADFAENTVSLEIKPEKATTNDGITIATGTYHLTGTTAKAEKIDVYGGYNNTMVKEKGVWKISKQVLSAL
ncbi:MAG: nuclear transport factor 2 family protein [Ferruginibacter sp.]